MRPYILALVVGLAAAPSVEAGAWLRDEGAGFASGSVTTNEAKEIFSSGYFEYGLRKDRTLGLDISYGFDRTGVQQGSAIVFLRFPLGIGAEPNKWAFHVGLGARSLNQEFLPAGEVGVSWGRGIQLMDQYGWVNIDTSFNVAASPATERFKIDGTFGLGLNDRIKVMLQLFNTFQDGDTFTKVAPSILIAAGKTGTTFQLGAEIPAAGGGETSIKIGLWRDF